MHRRHIFVLNRRYEEAIDYYRKAIAAQPDLWSAHSQLGINLMRLGQDERSPRRARNRVTTTATRTQPTTNTLRLMDSYKNFVTYKTDRTILSCIRRKPSCCILTSKPKWSTPSPLTRRNTAIKLDRPVQVEVYPDHEDFAVRTLGMPGLGALGVTFGYVVAMDSPSGRPPGRFHWATTMWHEMSHVYL